MSNRVVFLGGGFSSLCLGALLGRDGWDVTILEQSENIGGYAQTVSLDGYRFSLGPRYLWDFGPGDIGASFYEDLGLLSSDDFIKLDEDAFDEIYLGSDLVMRVPMGWEAFRMRMKESFPENKAGIDQFFNRCADVYGVFKPCIDRDLDYIGYRALAAELITGGQFFKRSSLVRSNLFRTLEDEFNRCGLSAEVRSVLSAHLAIVAEAPCDMSFVGYVIATLNYHQGSYYPKHHIECMVDKLVGFIKSTGGSIHCRAAVEEISVAAGRVQSVLTEEGIRYDADIFVSNLDPRVTGELLNRRSSLSKKRYDRSNSLLSFFIGCELDNAAVFPFGRGQKWLIKDEKTFSRPIFGPNSEVDKLVPEQLYLNSPSTFSSEDTAGPGVSSRLITGFAPGSYGYYSGLSMDEYSSYVEQKKEAILGLIEDVLWGDVRGCMNVYALHTPIDNERLLRAPEGCIYGKRFRPGDIFIHRMGFNTVIPNLKLCSAFTSNPGLASCIRGAKFLHRKLTR